MKHIFKILSKSFWKIILVIILLFMQAFGELSLPDFTSNIINVGIQANGIDSNVPQVMRKNTFETIVLFNDDKVISDSYELVLKGNKKYIKQYPLLKEEDIYVLKDISKKEFDSLNKIIAKPLMLVGIINNNKLAKTLGIDDNFIKMLPYMNDKQLSLIKQNFNSGLEKIEKSLLDQLIVTIIKNEYEIIGVDIDSLQMNYLLLSGLKMLFIAFCIVVIAIFINYLSSKIASLFAKNLRDKVVSKVMSFSNAEFEKFSVASLITRTTNDIQQIQMTFVAVLRMLIYAPILGFGALMKINNHDMSWVIALGIGAILVIILVLFGFVIPKFKIFQKLIDRVNLVFREILSGVSVIRAFANQKHEEQRFDEANKNLTKNTLFIGKAMSFMMPTMMLVMNLVCILIVWVGASKIDAGNMQVGDLMAFITYTIQVIMSFLMIAMMTIMLPRSIVSIKRIGEVLNKENSILEKKELQAFNKKQKGLIEFKDVYFRYFDANEDVLENINFKIMPGTTTAFIGSTGSGKSTLVNLILRFFDVTAGKILIDGVDIKDVRLKDLREKIGYVPQKGQLFSGTIKSNIGFGKERINMSEVIDAAKISQAKEFIENKKDKYDSIISQGATNLSGGQKQRIAIARAIFKKPEIIIFDDSFSALDYKTDLKLRKALEKKLTDTTVIIVAQRISTILKADQIIVLDEGNIVGIGKHEDLMKECKIYKEIALSQLSEEELK